LLGQHALLDPQNLWQVDLEQADAIGPGEPERTRVEPGGQQDNLAAAGRCRGEQVVVEEAGADRAVEEERGAERGQAAGDDLLFGKGADERRCIGVVEEPVGAAALGGSHSCHAQRGLAEAAQRLRRLHRPPLTPRG
jgi:hypothetical protein